MSCEACGGAHEAGSDACPLRTREEAPNQIETRAGTPTARRQEGLPDVGSKYRVLRLLGRGGMGAVYEAEHLALRKTVAIKRLTASADPGAIERLRREAEAATRIGHPNIVAVQDFDVGPDGLPFVVMEKLDGEDLRARITRQGRLPAAETIEVVSRVCDALGAAHRAGILHRDVKPENVFLARAPDGKESVKLLDFGLSRAQDGQTLTVEGQVLGTAAYMAPEQVRGLRATERSDVYSVALVAYECLSGVQPFFGEGFEGTLGRVLLFDPDPPTRAGAPPECRPLDEVVMRGMEKDAGRRWASVAEFESALQAAWEGRSVSGVRGTALRRRLRSRAARIGAAVVVIGLVTAGILSGWLRTSGPSSEERRAQVRSLLSRAERTLDWKAREDLAREAMRLAPDDARALRFVAEGLVNETVHGQEGRRHPAAAEARTLLARAIELSADDPAAYVVLGRLEYYMGRDLEALRAFETLDRIAPRSAEGIAGRIRVLWLWGRREDLARELARCRRIDPANKQCGTFALREAILDDGPAAASQFLDDPAREAVLAPMERVTARVFAGRLGEARLAREVDRTAFDHLDAPHLDGLIAKASGDEAGARRHLADLRRIAERSELVPVHRRLVAVQVAELAAFVGDPQTVAWAAERGLRAGFVNAPWWERHFLFEQARTEGRLADVIARAKAESDVRWSQAAREGLMP